jgi:hypothetical protein
LQVESLEERCLLSASRFSLQLPNKPPPHSKFAKMAEVHVERSTPVIDSDGGPRGAVNQRLPDLIVWASEENGYLYDWRIDTSEPTMPGRRLLRLTNTVANVGTGPVELRGGDTSLDGTQEVFQRIYDDASGFTDRLAGTFVFHPTHGHIHFEDFTNYNLRTVTEGNGVGDIVASGEKVSFCLLDVREYDTSLPGAPNAEQYESCNEFQGISVGWSDVYNASLANQWIDITDVPEGTYWLESVVDPSDRILESDETNNAARIMISLGPPPPDDFPDTFDQATPITLSSTGAGTQAGRLDTRGDVDMFSFIAPRKGRIKITQAATGGELDSFLKVYGSDERQIAQDDDSAGSMNSRVRIKVAKGQKYYVAASGYNGDTGQYLLTFAKGR